MHASILELIVPLYLLLVAVAGAALWRERRIEHRLRWPRTTTQRHMEKYGARFMSRLGWSVELAGSHANHSLYRCMKQEDFLFVTFLRENSFYQRMLLSLRRESLEMRGRIVVVLYEPPSPMMLATAVEGQVWLLHYLDLPQIEDRHAALLPQVMAARTNAPMPRRGWAGLVRGSGTAH